MQPCAFGKSHEFRHPYALPWLESLAEFAPGSGWTLGGLRALGSRLQEYSIHVSAPIKPIHELKTQSSPRERLETIASPGSFLHAYLPIRQFHIHKVRIACPHGTGSSDQSLDFLLMFLGLYCLVILQSRWILIDKCVTPCVVCRLFVTSPWLWVQGKYTEQHL